MTSPHLAGLGESISANAQGQGGSVPLVWLQRNRRLPGGLSGSMRIPEPVYHDVMVEPAQGGQILGVMVTTGSSRSNVMGLEPVARPAPIDGAGPVPPRHQTTQRRWNRPRSVTGQHRFPVGQSD